MVNLCTQLRSITFKIATFVHQPGLDNGVPWNSVILSLLMIPSASLHGVIINTDVYYGDVGGAIEELSVCVDWERLEGALESHRSLEAVTLGIAGVDPWAAASREELQRFDSLVESRLVRVSARGILQFTVPVR